MFQSIGDYWGALKVKQHKRHLIQNKLTSTIGAALLGLRPDSDIRRWKKWADQCPPHLQTLPETIPDDVPYRGLRNYWYPAMAAKTLRKNELKPVRLLGDDLVLFRAPDGSPRALDDVCPHRQSRLSLGWVNVHAPGTVTCPYHGWTFDGDGRCVANLTEGPDSPIPKNVRTRAYPIEERHHVIWVYMGSAEQVPDLDDNIPHAGEAMSGSWPWFIHWDWPVNYLNALDNDADPAHACFAHATCSQFLDQGRWNGVTATKIPECGGLDIGLTKQGPAHRGPRSSDGWDMHVPGYIYFAPSPPKWPVGAMFWAVPIDEAHMRMFVFTTFPGTLLDRLRLWFQQSLYWRPWGLPNNIYHCNRGPDRALLMSQGILADWSLENRTQTDIGVIMFRKMMRDAFVRDKELEGAADPDLAPHRRSRV